MARLGVKCLVSEAQTASVRVDRTNPGLTSSNLVSSATTIPALTRAGIAVSEVRDEFEAPFVR